ncbi:Stomatin-like protein 1, partial [Armadillidium vulgare]
MVSYAKYSLVPTEDPKDKAENKSAPSGAFDYSSAFNYKSAFEYNSNNPSHYQSAFDYGYGPKKNSSLGIEKERKKKRESFSLMDCITAFVTGISYFIIGITFPCTLWFCIKRLKQWERLIVFRIGRLRGVLGPGIVFVVPWIDRYTRVDMRTKAFSVPPQQLITVDNGIIEMGCEVKYRVSDVQQLTTSVITPQHGLRSFGKTVMLNVLTKHTVREMERDRLQIASEILKELNTRVANWGIEIGQVDFALGSSGSSGSPVATGPDGFFGAGGKPGMVASGILEGGMATIPPVVSKGSSSLLDFSTLAKISGLGGFQGFSITGMEKKKARPEAAGNHDKMNTDLIQLLDDTNSKSNNSLYSKQRPKDKEGIY